MNIFFNAVANSKSMELLTEQELGFLCDATNIETMLKILGSHNLLQGLNIQTYNDLISVVELDEKNFLDFVKQNVVDKKITAFFCLNNDYYNIQCAFTKIRLQKMNLSYKPEGLYKIADIEKAIENKNYGIFSNEQKFCLETLDKTEKLTGFVLDTAFKKAKYLEFRRLSACNKDLSIIAQTYIDGLNLKNALRFKDKNLMEVLFLEGGKVTKKELENLMQKDYNKILNDTKFDDNALMIKFICTALIEKKPMTKFEKMQDLFAVNYFEAKKTDVNGLTPYLRYCYLKLNEISNLRVIFEGKINGLNKNQIKNDIRRVYL